MRVVQNFCTTLIDYLKQGLVLTVYVQSTPPAAASSAVFKNPMRGLSYRAEDDFDEF